MERQLLRCHVSYLGRERLVLKGCTIHYIGQCHAAKHPKRFSRDEHVTLTHRWLKILPTQKRFILHPNKSSSLDFLYLCEGWKYRWEKYVVTNMKLNRQEENCQRHVQKAFSNSVTITQLLNQRTLKTLFFVCKMPLFGHSNLKRKTNK